MIGHVSLSNVVRGAFQSCNLGYSQDENACGKGYMTEALRVVLHFAFTEADLHRVEANVVPANTASIGVLKRLGFRQEGEAKRYLKINGDWEDHLRFAILKEEFQGNPQNWPIQG
jgi:ribosomal-protein-alanine N-acetyltransferase